MKIAKTFRLEEEYIDELEKYARLNSITNTEAIQTAIHRQYVCIADKSSENNQNKSENKALDALIKQLEIKDKQIDDLTESLRAAQALHAADKGLGKLSGAVDANPIVVKDREESKPSFWQRIVNFWS